jgi:hypothetical protein
MAVLYSTAWSVGEFAHSPDDRQLGYCQVLASVNSLIDNCKSVPALGGNWMGLGCWILILGNTVFQNGDV